MSTYRTVVVGTDGSDSSLRAVDRAGAIAAAAHANLIVASAYFPHAVDRHAADGLRNEGYKVTGNAPVYALLRDARDRAKEAGAADIKERAMLGAPVEALRRPGRRGRRGPVGGRQRRAWHHQRATARIGARQHLAQGQGRRADRAHHLIDGAFTAAGGGERGAERATPGDR